MIGGAILPFLLHRDPRYFYRGKGTTGPRIRHAMLSTFVARTDNGKSQPNYSSLGAVSGIISVALNDNQAPPPGRLLSVCLIGRIYSLACAAAFFASSSFNCSRVKSVRRGGRARVPCARTRDLLISQGCKAVIRELADSRCPVFFSQLHWWVSGRVLPKTGEAAEENDIL
jgi:hypothetical protein